MFIIEEKRIENERFESNATGTPHAAGFQISSLFIQCSWSNSIPKNAKHNL